MPSDINVNEESADTGRWLYTEPLGKRCSRLLESGIDIFLMDLLIMENQRSGSDPLRCAD